MKIEVGMYVKTKGGIIGQVKGYNAYDESKIAIIVGKTKEGILRTPVFDKNEIIKASDNIINLIEPMDLMYIDISPDNCNGIVVPRMAETLDELNEYKEKFASGKYILKGIVTHEQITNNMYKVGE